jgi:hypothetical protein
MLLSGSLYTPVLYSRNIMFRFDDASSFVSQLRTLSLICLVIFLETPRSAWTAFHLTMTDSLRDHIISSYLHVDIVEDEICGRGLRATKKFQARKFDPIEGHTRA